jgi:hypothetical protein
LDDQGAALGVIDEFLLSGLEFVDAVLGYDLRDAPLAKAAIWARRSPMTTSGVRLFVRSSRMNDSSITPRDISFIGGIWNPS